MGHLWRSWAGRGGDCRNLPGGAFSKAPIAAFQSHFHRITRLIPGGITGLRGLPYSSISQPWIRSRARRRRPLGVRLRFADVAAGFSLRGARRGAAPGRASGALRLFLRPSRDARAAGSGARPRPRRGLSRHRLPGALRKSARDTIAYLRAREQVTSVYRERIRPIWLKREPERRVPALCYMVDRRARAIRRAALARAAIASRAAGHGQSGANRDYVIATVGALEQLGYRETELHLLAARLAGTHEASATSRPSSS